MKEVYESAKVVLIPSVWEEPFGRIAVKAGINGIPSIASDSGGLPESVGNGGIIIKDLWNINKWVGAIKRLNDPDENHGFQRELAITPKSSHLKGLLRLFNL
jgi:glycosyltransferase involved in cell wall biosynthesis